MQDQQQKIERADHELALLDAEEQQLQTRLQALATDITALQSRAAQRLHLLETTRTNTQQIQAKAADLAAQTNLAEGTTRHAELLKQKKQSDESVAAQQKEMERIETKSAREESEDTTKLTTALTEQGQAQARLLAIRTERQAMQRAREVAHAAIGNLVYQEIADQIAAVEARIAERNQHNQDDEQTLNKIVQVGLDRLRPWPGQHLQLYASRPVCDSVTKVIASTIAYIETLLNEREGLNQDLPMNSTRGLYSWWEIICVHTSELYGVNAPGLPDKLRRLKELQQEYAASLQQR